MLPLQGGLAGRLRRGAAPGCGIAVGRAVRRLLRPVALRVPDPRAAAGRGAATSLLILGALTALVGDRLRAHPGQPPTIPRVLDRRARRRRPRRPRRRAARASRAHQPILAAAGLLAATLHVCAHNLAKTLALITVDRIEQATGQRTHRPPRRTGPAHCRSVAVALGVSSLTLAAIPPLGGFVSEWFTFEALLQGFRMPTLLSRLLCALAAAALALTAGLGLLAFAKFYSFIFLGPARDQLARVREPTRWPVGAGGTRSHPALPRHRRAVGDPRGGRGAAAAARPQPGGHHDQSPARPHPGVRRILGARPDLADDHPARLRAAGRRGGQADARRGRSGRGRCGARPCG